VLPDDVFVDDGLQRRIPACFDALNDSELRVFYQVMLRIRPVGVS
jgi:hypothetical protein